MENILKVAETLKSDEEIVMTSLEFSELTGKTHGHILTTIDRLNETFKELNKKIIFPSLYKSKTNNKARIFKLTNIDFE